MSKDSTITEELRAAIRKSGKTDYRIAKDAGIGPEQVGRFLAGADIRLSTAERLCSVLGLELRERIEKTKGG